MSFPLQHMFKSSLDYRVNALFRFSAATSLILLSDSVLAQSCLTLRPYELQPARLLCSWDSSGKDTGVGSHSLQGIFLTQGSNPGLSPLQADSLPYEPPGKPHPVEPYSKFSPANLGRIQITLVEARL